MNQLPILYKLSNTKKIIVWKIEVINEENNTFIQVTRGQDNGKMIVTKKQIKKGKGKKSILEQAFFEANSKWKNKILYK